MKVFEDAWRRSDLPRRAVVTIGNFDGLHLGQRRLIDRVLGRARALGVEALLVTFEPHPMKVLRPAGAPLCLTTASQKLELLKATGIDAVAVIDFSSQFAATSAPAFVEEFVAGRLRATELYVGSRFTFGRGREGDLAYLVERGSELGFEAHGVAELEHQGEAISSTRVRRLIAEGQIVEAAELLGRPYALYGRVEPGDARGRQLGWPTANLAVENELFPGDGVYATEALLEDESDVRLSVTNVGTRPTFGAAPRMVESHLLDFDADIYGLGVELRFRRRLRGERRFASPDELVRQIDRDVRGAREYFATRVC